ncbi:helicase [Cellulophaga phage phi47:1]|uniref:helicase n=1 Tax=Cellulophaga phage phiSM TaxID=756280 RepID=UPI0002B790B2|nr:helicase [Cellulophaga phage phiSM]AGF91631.1 helicase [Cellulophaga phage phi47:1]AGO47770.1 helicase [Cellulophaga phage phi3ST:2]AGO49278.1 helicase [Cellulophaga phage phi38:2]AGO49358.1 helicase [Cellulophaga phage phi3:1]AGH07788.1 helicase [Cellulophaga phage phiSM]
MKETVEDIILYKYQESFVKNINKQFRKGNYHVLGQSATGSGKTIMFSAISSRVSKKSKKVLILTDRTELLSQAGGTIEKFKMNPFYISSGVKFIDKTKDIYVGMSRTMQNRMKSPVWLNFVKNEIDLIIIDEAHKQEFNWVFEIPWMKKKYVIGFTATPVRSGKMVQLGVQYDAIVKGKPIKWLIKKGYLLNCDIYNCGEPDLTSVAVNKSKGDFSESSLFKTYDNAKLYKGLVKNYLKFAKGKKGMVFCCNVEHAIKTAKQLHKAGIPAKFIASNPSSPKEPRKWTPASKAIFDEKFKSYKLYQKNFHKLSGEREQVFEWFKKSKDGILVNVDIATTGFDDPTVTFIGLYRATMSLVLYLQILGRGARIIRDGSIDKFNFTVLDFGGNKGRFGPYDVERDWSLWHEETKTDGGVPPMKICGEDSKLNKLKGAGEVKKGCERLILAAYKLCPFCGFKYPEDKDKVKDADLQLASIVDEKGVSLKAKAFKDMDFQELTTYREIQAYHIHWLYNQLWSRKEEKTIKEYAKWANWNSRRLYKVLLDMNLKFKK